VLACTRRDSAGKEKWPWVEHEVVRSNAAGIANRRTAAQAEAKKLARQSKPSTFVAFEARNLWSIDEKVHLRPGHFWIAELAEGGKEEGSPIAEVFTANGTREGIAFSRGDEAMKIKRWLSRDPLDPNGLTFVDFPLRPRVGDRLADPTIVNVTELRAIEVKLKKVMPLALQVKRNAKRGAAVVGEGARRVLMAAAGIGGGPSQAIPPDPNKGATWVMTNVEDNRIRSKGWAAMGTR